MNNAHHAHGTQGQEEAYYVGIEGSVELRRHILETARETVLTVGSHKRIQQIQEEKLKLRSHLVRIIHDMRKDLHDLNIKLPKRDIPEEVHKHHQHTASPKKKPVDHKLDKIESALAEIEARMKQL